MTDTLWKRIGRTTWIAALAILTAAASGCAGSDDTAAAEAPANALMATTSTAEAGAARATTVEMTNDLNFSPQTVRIQVGETVTWRNTSDVGHTVTADKDLANDPSNVQLPEGAQPFNSGTVQSGESFSKTFETAGTYKYVCLPHEAQGMTGTVIVEPRG